jgi:two-component system LytT family response regulator
VTPERLFRAFGKVKEHLQNRAGAAEDPSDEVLIARTSEGLHKLNIVDIAYAESKANYSVLHLLDGSAVMVLVGLKQLEEQLPTDRFLRIHKAYLINWSHAGLIGKEHVLVAGKYEVPIGDSHRKELLERIAGHRSLKR